MISFNLLETKFFPLHVLVDCFFESNWVICRSSMKYKPPGLTWGQSFSKDVMIWQFVCPPSSTMTSKFPPDSSIHRSSVSGSLYEVDANLSATLSNAVVTRRDGSTYMPSGASGVPSRAREGGWRVGRSRRIVCRRVSETARIYVCEWVNDPLRALSRSGDAPRLSFYNASEEPRARRSTPCGPSTSTWIQGSA